MKNGVTAFPGWTYGSEVQPGGMIDTITGTEPPQFPITNEKTQSVAWVNAADTAGDVGEPVPIGSRQPRDRLQDGRRHCDEARYHENRDDPRPRWHFICSDRSNG